MKKLAVVFHRCDLTRQLERAFLSGAASVPWLLGVSQFFKEPGD